MMKYIISLILSFCVFGSCAQTIVSANHVKGKRFGGFIFSKYYPSIFIHWEDLKDRFTSTDSDVMAAEAIIDEKITKENMPSKNQVYGCPIIEKYLNIQDNISVTSIQMEIA